MYFVAKVYQWEIHKKEHDYLLQDKNTEQLWALPNGYTNLNIMWSLGIIDVYT